MLHASLMLLVLHLLLYLPAEGVCFGPCHGRISEIRANQDTVEVECSRFYHDRQYNRGCLATGNTWNRASDSVNEFAAMEKTYEQEGRQGAELACEKVCAATNACRAFAVSSDAHVTEGAWQCTIFYTCESTQFHEHLDLYRKKEPFECLIQATSYDGVFVNFIESNGIVSQTSRVLSLDTKPFQDVHVKVNGVFNTTFLGYRPYKTAKEALCEQYDSDCVILHAGGYSATIIVGFCLIVAFNSCILYVSLTKPNELTAQPLRKPTQLRTRKNTINPTVSTTNGNTLRSRSSQINF